MATIREHFENVKDPELREKLLTAYKEPKCKNLSEAIFSLDWDEDSDYFNLLYTSSCMDKIELINPNL